MSASPSVARRQLNRDDRRPELSPARGPNSNLSPSSRVRRQANADLVNRDASKPLLDTDKTNQPPLAGPEIDDLDTDNRETVNNPYPGVDDGFFNKPDMDAENIPKKTPDDPEPAKGTPAVNIPSDDGPDSGRFPANRPKSPGFPGRRDSFPRSGYDPEVFDVVPDYAGTEFSESIPDVNVYQHKKTLAQGMMDLALFSANANQLRYVLESFDRHPYYYPSIVLISISLILQVAVGVGLIWNAKYNVKDKKEICIANKISNFTIIGIFLITVVNVFVSAFGVANAPSIK